MPNDSKDFAQQIRDGTLSFSDLEGCDSELSVNQNSLIIRYNQLFLLRQDRKAGSPYLSFWPFLNSSVVSQGKRDDVAGSLATGILSSIPTEKDLENELIPKPQGQDQLLEKKRILIQKNIIGPKQGLSANQIHSEYRKFIEQRAQTELAPIQNVFAGALGISRQDFKNRSKLSRTIATRLLDPFYSSGLARYKFAVFGLYEQEWKHVGYSRGDLIKSLSLCPGETVTLEYHYWDKSTVKSEQELSSELELKSSSTLTQRDSKELLDELTKNNQFKLDANSKISVPLPPVDISGGDEAGISTQVQPHVTDAIKSSVESVVNVSHDFKQTRKVRIEETREIGREEKQTRVIANTNRCHTLEFRYFEVMSNYLLTSRCVGFQGCLLLPFVVECEGKAFSCERIDAKFILCNEHVLKSVLIDPKFEAGFDAAKKLESFAKLKDLFAENVVSGPAVGSSPSTALTGSDQAIENEYQNFRNDILNAYSKLNSAANEVGEAFANLSGDNIFGGIGDILASIFSAVRKFPAWVALNLDSDTHNAIEALEKSNKPARQAMRDFFAKVSENDFQFLNPVTGDVADALQELGVPFSDQIAGFIFDFGLIGAVGNAVKDDGGLHDAVQAAEGFFNSTDKTPTGQVTTPPAGAPGETPPTTTPPPTVADFVSINDIADASVELERLICHIKCNCQYYKQALWLSKGPDYRAHFLAKARVSQFLSNEVVGFFEDYVAFPIIDPSFLQKVLNLRALLRSLSANKPKDVSALITIPTSSTVMSGQMGECDLCEEYIKQSRDADIRQQNAKAALDEAEAAYKNARTNVAEQEAARIAARIASRPPDLSDPIEHSNAKLDISVTTQDANP